MTMPTPNRSVHLTLRAPFWLAQFTAMACPCEALITVEDKTQASQIAQAIANEVWRIEDKYSRFTKTSITAAINNANGQPITLDNETTALFHYAQQLYELSDGLFDISAGALKNIWAFHQKKTAGPQELPTQASIQAVLPSIDLAKANLAGNTLALPKGMQIDFGGIGKEYAADKSLRLALEGHPSTAILVNLGGDLVASQCLPNRPWHIGFNDTKPNNNLTANDRLTFQNGAVTTSGTSQRQWVIDGKSYSHLLNPKTGWPVLNPPKAVTVAAPTCMQAGMLSTLIMLQGEHAETFAHNEAIKCWITR